MFRNYLVLRVVHPVLGLLAYRLVQAVQVVP